MIITQKGYAKLANNHISTGFIVGVLGNEVETDK